MRLTTGRSHIQRDCQQRFESERARGVMGAKALCLAANFPKHLLNKLMKSSELLLKVLPAVCLCLFTFQFWVTKYDRWRVLESSTFCCCQLFLFFSGGWGGGGGCGGERRLDNRMIGGFIAICLVLKEFGCLFLLFSNPRIPMLKLPYIRSL